MKQGLPILILLLFYFTGYSQRSVVKQTAKQSPAVKEIISRLQTGVSGRFVLQTSDLSIATAILQKNRLERSIVGKFSGSGALVVELSLTQIDSLFPGDLVRFVDVLRKPREESHIEGFDFTANGLNRLFSRFPQYRGSGLTFSVKEQKLDSEDLDFRGRFISSSLAAPNTTTHATQMATMAGGAGNSSDFSRGAAWGAGISSSSFESLLPDPIAEYKKYGISVQNHSYGTGIENYYGADAVAYDASTRQIPALLHVFSAGNAGDQAPGSGYYEGMTGVANLTGSFKMAKNIITVGATDSVYFLETRSSRGPAYDGRIKPEVVAYGNDGSSGAAAIVSGIAVSLQDACKQRTGALPAASLVKAVLLNTARDVASTGIDFKSGFGSVDGYEAMRAMHAGWYFTGNVQQGATREFNIPVPAGCSELKVLLCWTDPEASANSPKALVNDLDLELVDPGGIPVFPWVLNPLKSAINDLPVRGKDTLNNVEQVTIDHPVSGNYTVRVHSQAQQSPMQEFAVSYYYRETGGFTWEYPDSADQLKWSARNLLRWRTELQQPGSLFVSYDSGLAWEPIEQQINPEAGSFSWYPLRPGNARLKMETGGQQYFSGPFTVSSPVFPTVGYNCGDSSLLFWHFLSTADRYKLYRLNGSYMEPFAETTDTFFIVPGNQGNLVSVAPVFGATAGQRGFTVDLRNQGVGCYFSSLLADLFENGTVQITLSLGSLYQVERIVLEKSNGIRFEPFQEVTDPGSLIFHWTDGDIKQGFSFYRAKLILSSGQTVYSDIARVANPAGNDFLVFPNPARLGQPVGILSRDTEAAELWIFDLFGRIVLKRKLTDQVEAIRISQAGLFPYQVRVGGRLVKSGRLVIQ